jgi:undecaprenyl-diphosphatase
MDTLVFIFLYFIIKQEGKSSWKVLVAILFCILISDQVCSGLLKPWVARLRPCHEPSLASLIHLVGGCGGQFGFCSSHAASFTLAVFFYLQYGKQQIGSNFYFLGQ